jgi:hypothetical protein
MGERELRCVECRDAIVCCEFCDGEDCPKAICYGCLIVALGEHVPYPRA